MSDEDVQLQSLSRRSAKSGRVDYGDPVILSETSRTQVTFVPFFIPHSDHTELASKIVTSQKKTAPFDWVMVPEKSVSLSEEATLRLLTSLQSYLRVAEGNEDGSFILIRGFEGTAQLGAHDPAQVASALAKVLSREEILSHLQNMELTTELTAAFRGAIRLSEMKAAVTALRCALDGGDDDESTYQNWCEKHSWAFGNAYVVRDEVREISPGDHLDLLLPTVIAGYRDLVELKRPSMEVLHWDDRHRNFYFSSQVSRAIGQCHRYLDVLHESAANGLRDHPEIVAYHPRATIVIGRSYGWPETKLRALHGLNHRLSCLSIMTYDQLLAQGERLISLLSAPPQPEPAEPESTDFDDDEIPF
jgi:Shedu protein SduA, C-terminal